MLVWRASLTQHDLYGPSLRRPPRDQANTLPTDEGHPRRHISHIRLVSIGSPGRDAASALLPGVARASGLGNRLIPRLLIGHRTPG